MGGGKSDGPVTIKNVAAGTEDTDAVNVGQLKSAGLVDNNGNTLDAVVYDPGSNRGQVTLGGVGASAPVVLTNVANGVNQYDAVNFGQLSGLQSDLQNQINTVNGQVTNIDNRVTTLESNGGGNGGGTPEYVAANPSTQPTAGANVGDTTGVALGYNTAATGDSASAVGDSAQATGDNSTAVGSSAVASSTGATALGSSASVNASNGVAVGNNATVASSASNGTAVGSGSSVNAASGTAVGQGASVASTATNSVALGAGSVATQANSVSVGSAGNERTITNEAAGVNATDAVNVGQLQGAQNWAQSYTDQKVNQLNSRITSVGRHADAGTAGAIAMTNIPQAYQPNQSSVGAGIGAFNGQAAVAVGMSTITPSGRWVLKGSLTGNSQGDVGIGFGASMVW
jgi:autotransporter adhesin